MATIGTRKNKKTGEEEIIIKDINNDLDKLLDTIYEFRRKEKKENKTKSDENKIQNIFIIDKLDFSELTTNRNIHFYNCIFEKTVILNNCIFEKTAIFTKCNFNNPISAKATVFNGITSFNHSKFNGINTNFILTKFNNKALFNNVDFSSKITNFETTEFNNKTFFIKADFHNKVNIRAIFNDSICFNEAKFFGDRIKFNGSTFNKKVRFHHCEFYNWVKFENTTFNKLVDFYRAKFLAPQQFHLTDFMDRVIFSDAVFEKEAQFIHCKADINSIINFHSTTFNKGLDISRSNFNICKVSFWDIKINGLNEALSSELYKNNFGDYEYLPSVPKKLRESMRFIKNNFYAENNRIEGLDFYKEEMKIYEKELKSVDWQNRFLLFLHKNSNNFETDWIMGVLFTILVGLITFSFIMISLILSTPPELEITDKFQDFLYNLGQIINIAEWSDIKIYGTEITSWSYVWLFIGRIFIGYGYYQTIQAFRKYGKS